MRVGRTLVCVVVVLVCWLGDVPPASARSDVVWRREPIGRLGGLTVDAAGHVFVTGGVWAPPAGTNRYHREAMLVAKYGPAGGLAWRRTWRVRATGRWASGHVVAPAPGGGVYVGGADGWYEDDHPMVWRYAATGRLVWRRRLPLSLDRGYVSSIAPDRRGGLVVAVQSVGPCCDSVLHDGWVLALDPAGRVRWRTDFEAPGVTGTWDAVRDVAVGGDGRVYAVGHVDRAYTGSPDRPVDEDVVVLQLRTDGALGWARLLGDPGVRDRDEATAVGVRAGVVAVAGEVDGRRARSSQRGWLAMFTTGGARRWARRWGPVGTRHAITIPDLAFAPWGAVYVATERTVYRAGESRTSAGLRRYAHGGRLVSRRTAPDGMGITAVTARFRLYLVVGGGLERWRR
ncbi:MAG: hypothetical protein ACM3OO_09235 [Planctomycetaceae bacterium]